MKVVRVGILVLFLNRRQIDSEVSLQVGLQKSKKLLGEGGGSRSGHEEDGTGGL